MLWLNDVVTRTEFCGSNDSWLVSGCWFDNVTTTACWDVSVLLFILTAFPSFGLLNDFSPSLLERDLEPGLLGPERDFDCNNWEKSWLNFSPDINLKIGRRVGREAAVIPTNAEWLFFFPLAASGCSNPKRKKEKKKEGGGNMALGLGYSPYPHGRFNNSPYIGEKEKLTRSKDRKSVV